MDAAIDKPDVLTVKEAATLLRVSETTIYSSAASGDLPSYRIGSQRRFSRRALLSLLETPHPDGAEDAQGAPEVLPMSAVRREKLGKVGSGRG